VENSTVVVGQSLQPKAKVPTNSRVADCTRTYSEYTVATGVLRRVQPDCTRTYSEYSEYSVYRVGYDQTVPERILSIPYIHALIDG
jgi:hypothetical protein